MLEQNPVAVIALGLLTLSVAMLPLSSLGTAGNADGSPAQTLEATTRILDAFHVADTDHAWRFDVSGDGPVELRFILEDIEALDAFAWVYADFHDARGRTDSAVQGFGGGSALETQPIASADVLGSHVVRLPSLEGLAAPLLDLTSNHEEAARTLPVGTWYFYLAFENFAATVTIEATHEAGAFSHELLANEPTLYQLALSLNRDDWTNLAASHTLVTSAGLSQFRHEFRNTNRFAWYVPSSHADHITVGFGDGSQCTATGPFATVLSRQPPLGDLHALAAHAKSPFGVYAGYAGYWIEDLPFPAYRSEDLQLCDP